MTVSRLAVLGLSAAALIVAAILTIRYGAIPVLSSQRHIASAEVRELNGNSSAALNELQLAIQEDPLAVESRQQKARLLTYNLLRVERLNLSGKRNGPTISTEDHVQQNQTARIKSDTDRAFDLALAAANDFIEADRRGWNGYYVRSQVLRIRSDKMPLDSGVRNAVDDMLAGVERYPTNAQLLAELAESLNEAGRVQASVDVARRAMRQEEINRDWGHVDRYLDTEVLERLQKITVGLRP